MGMQFNPIVWIGLLVDRNSDSLITCLFALGSTGITVEDLQPAQEFLLHHPPRPVLLILSCPLTCCNISLSCPYNTFGGTSEPCQTDSFPINW